MVKYQVTYLDFENNECREEFTDLDEALQFIKSGLFFATKFIIDKIRK